MSDDSEFEALPLSHGQPCEELVFGSFGWNVAWFVDAPWPERAVIHDYDFTPSNGLIEIEVENGSAKYEVVSTTTWGDYYCKLRSGSTYTQRGKIGDALT